MKTVLEMLTPEQIGAAFASAGYLDMTPDRATFIKRIADGQSNDATAAQYVYSCLWIEQDGDKIAGNAYVRIVNGVVVAEC